MRPVPLDQRLRFVFIAGKPADSIGAIRDDANRRRPSIIEILCGVEMDGDLPMPKNVTLTRNTLTADSATGENNRRCQSSSFLLPIAIRVCPRLLPKFRPRAKMHLFTVSLPGCAGLASGEASRRSSTACPATRDHSPYSLIFRYSVRSPMPSLLAAYSRLPPETRSVSVMNSFSISASVRPTRPTSEAIAGSAERLRQAGQFFGQIVGVQQAVVVDHHHAFDHIAKLADVARPREGQHSPPRGGRHPRIRLACLAANC